MNHKDYIDFDTNEFPLAYLITFRCYGTWLHGDERGSMDRSMNHRYGSPKIPSNKALQRSEALLVKHPPVTLGDLQRTVIEAAIHEVCDHRKFRAYATRRLREKGLMAPDVKPWSRHGSTRYLWKPHHVARAIDYVINGQENDEPPDFDD
jgi:hypothetical protein